MNTVIIIISIVASVIGLVVSIRTMFETRRKYYNEYLKRKRNEKA